MNFYNGCIQYYIFHLQVSVNSFVSAFYFHVPILVQTSGPGGDLWYIEY